MKTTKLQIKRIYDSPSEKDGIRVLVDLLWPRGISKAKADLDYWYKEVAPSPDLRKWFSHKQNRFEEFKELYLGELRNNDSDELKNLVKMLTSNVVTLLYGAKDEKINHAVVLQEYLSGKRSDKNKRLEKKQPLKKIKR